MDQSKKKGTERHYAERFLSGLVECSSLEDSESPDFWIRRAASPDIGLEVTEYHPTADEVEGILRREIESRWWQGLEPRLDKLRKEKPELRNIGVALVFRDAKLPRTREHERLAFELIGLVTTIVSTSITGQEEIKFTFASRRDAEKCNQFPTGWTFLPQEDWPHCSRHLSSVSVRQWGGINWPPWTCPQVQAAWISPRPEEFNRVFAAKASKAENYHMGGSPLWLLIVVDLPGDTKSQLALSNEEDFKELTETINVCGFDFHNSPFNEVWLLSAFFGWKLQLHPGSTAAAGSP